MREIDFLVLVAPLGSGVPKSGSFSDLPRTREKLEIIEKMYRLQNYEAQNEMIMSFHNFGNAFWIWIDQK